MADNDTTKAAENLRKLGERARAGWAKLHPVSEKHLAAVRAAVTKQWEQDHGAKATVVKPAQAQTARSTPETSVQHASGKTQTKQSLRSQDHGKDHGHSH